jgi:hypothetical protein
MEKFKKYWLEFVSYFATLSQQSFTVASIAVLHSIFVPTTIAYLGGLTERLPSIDTVLLLLVGLSAMAISSIIKKDMVAVFAHMVGFSGQAILLSIVVFK